MLRGCEKIFTNELKNNLAQHRIDEIFLKYKLEAYQKNFPDFIYGSLISIEVLGQDEEIEVGPSGTILGGGSVD
jgi:hypothetical protein